MSSQRCEEKSTPARGKERERALWLLFLYVFPSPGPALYKLGQPGVLFVLPEVLTPVLRLPLTFLFSIFGGFSLSCLLATAILDFCFLF